MADLILVRRLNAPSALTYARMNESGIPSRKAVILGPGEGRSYLMGRIAAVFKADESESESRYSISEWWLEPHTQGSGPHSHPEDDIFYVIEGTMSVLAGERGPMPRGVPSFSSPVASPTTSKTAPTQEPECSTCRYRVRSSCTCPTSRSGLPKIHPKMQAPNQAMELTLDGHMSELSVIWLFVADCTVASGGWFLSR